MSSASSLPLYSLPPFCGNDFSIVITLKLALLTIFKSIVQWCKVGASISPSISKMLFALHNRDCTHCAVPP